MARKIAQPTQTRLGFQLRRACDDLPEGTLQSDVLRHKGRKVARSLDTTVFSLGVKGDGIRNLRAYATALKVFREIAGVDYVPPGKKA